MRRRLTTRIVALISVLIIAICVGWALLVDNLVPDACSFRTPPPNAQYVHCPGAIEP